MLDIDIETKEYNNKVSQSVVYSREGVVILGGGLAGLSAGHVLSKAGRQVIVIEKASVVGGLSITVVHDGFRFDLGGHRFITKSKKLNLFINELLKGDLLKVPRTSQIYLFNKYFDYPLKPVNAMFGLGLFTTLHIIVDYCKEKVKNFLNPPDIISLEDWVVSNFGRKMFDLYFKQYSEKVWGIDCTRISQEWVAKRIEGLSLLAAIKNAFFKMSGKRITTLADEFLYPPLGIGQISDRLREGIEERGCSVLTDTGVTRLNHENSYIRSITVKNNEQHYDVEGREFISSIPLTHLARMFQPAAPDDVLEAASSLKYRDIVIVTIMLNSERVTNLTWLYLPGKDIPIGRIHEPKNWSLRMAPEGKTSVVAEFFCFKGDKIWNSSDEELTSITVENLEKLGFIKQSEVIGSCVVRASHAYPLVVVGYREHYDKIFQYLKNFKNLHVIGRGGLFRYYNMDRAMESGIEIAEEIIGKGAAE